MKNKFFYWFILWSALTSLYGQKYVTVTYGKVLKSVHDTMSELKPVPGLKYKLIAGPGEAYFYYIKRLDEENTVQDKLAKKLLKGDIKIYWDMSQKKKYFEIPSGKVLLYDTIPSFKWQISRLSKKIAGYTCYKAVAFKKAIGIKPVGKTGKLKKVITTERYEAWFTPEIPYQVGPAGFDGLPGLILQVKYGGVYYVAQQVIFSGTKPAFKFEIIENQMQIDEYDRQKKKEVMQSLKRKGLLIE